MKKLFLEFKDGAKITYTMKNSVDWTEYFHRHSPSDLTSAVLQQYPKKNNEPLKLI